MKNINFCFCGSWKIYTDCCKNNPVPEWLTPTIHDDYLRLEKDIKKPQWVKIYEVKKLLRNSTCICSNCAEKAIASHLYPRSHLENSFWNHLWILDFDSNMNIVPRKKGIRQITWPVWCKNHDDSLFQLTDKNHLKTIKELKKNHKNKRYNQKYIQELCYKFLWVFKVFYMIRQKIFYLWLFFNHCEEKDFISFKLEYTKYNSICNLYLLEEQLRSQNFECERRYYMLNSSVPQKIYFSAPLFSSDGCIPYILYVYPHWWSFCCVIMRTLDSDSQKLIEYFQKKIKSNELGWLKKLMNWTLWVDFIR